MLMAEKKAYRDRVKLCLGAMPMLQITGLMQIVDKVDFPFHLRADVSIQLIFQNVPLAILVIVNSIEFRVWNGLSMLTLVLLVLGAFQNIVLFYNYSEEDS